MNARTNLAAGAIAVATLGGAAACASQSRPAASVSTTPSRAPTSASAPRSTVTITATPAPATQAPATPAPAPPTPAPAPVTPHFSNAGAVVQQYYQDITDHNYAAAWALGGDHIAGESYADYVAGFATTAGVSLSTVNTFGSDQVSAVLYATQTDGSVKVFDGTYTVANGVIVAADIKQQ